MNWWEREGEPSVSECIGDYGQHVGGHRVPSLADIDRAELPKLADDPASAAPATLLVQADPGDEVLSASAKLHDLVDIGLDEARKLIESEWDYTDPRFITAKSSMIQAIFTTATKVDDTSLRRRSAGVLSKLLDAMAVEEQKLPAI